MSSNKASLRSPRTGTTTVIPVGTMPRTKAGFFGGEGLGPPALSSVFSSVQPLRGSWILACFRLLILLQPDHPSISRPAPSFTYKDPDELNVLRDEAANRAPRVYVEEDDWEEKILGDLDKLRRSSTAAQTKTMRVTRWRPNV